MLGVAVAGPKPVRAPVNERERGREQGPATVGFSAASGLWGLLGIGCAWWVHALEPSLLEEGFHLHVAERMLAGEALYREIASFTGPLPFALLELLFAVFGSEIAVARAAVAALVGAATACAYTTTRRGGAEGWAHVAAASVATAPLYLFPLLAVYFYGTLAAYLGVLCVEAASRGLRAPRWALAAGVLAAAVALCKQTVGGLLAVLLVAALLACAPRASRLRTAGAAVAGGLAAALLTGLWYGVDGRLPALFESLVFLPLSFDTTFTSALPNFWPPGGFDAQTAAHQTFYLPHVYLLLGGDGASPPAAIVLLCQLAFLLPMALLIALSLRAFSGRVSPEAWLQGALLAALTSGLFPRSDWGHLVFALPSAFGLLALLARPARTQLLQWLPPAVAGLALFGALLLANGLHAAAGEARLGPRVPVAPVSGLYKGPALPRAIAWLRARLAPGEAIFVPRAEPLLYFATGARNPTPYGGVVPGMRERQQDEILAALPAVRFVVMSDLDRRVFTWSTLR